VQQFLKQYFSFTCLQCDIYSFDAVTGYAVDVKVAKLLLLYAPAYVSFWRIDTGCLLNSRSWTHVPMLTRLQTNLQMRILTRNTLAPMPIVKS